MEGEESTGSFVLEIIEGYEIKVSSNYNLIFYIKKHRVLIWYDNKTNNAYINRELIWNVFETKFNIKYQEIKIMMVYMLDIYLRLKGVETLYVITGDIIKIIWDVRRYE